MTFMEIALLIMGVIIFIISFLLPEGNEKKSEKEIAAEKEEVHRLVEQEIDSMKLKVNEATNDTVEYAVDKAERSLEKVSNEKIMAVGEYAGTIMEEINKNHKEVMFLYDMLRDKHTDITNAVREADAKVKEIENVSHTAQNASETLLRGMSVATVSQKGLTNEQKAVFDDIVIPDAKPVVFNNKSQNTVSEPVDKPKQKGIALAQSKIFADMMGEERPSSDTTVKNEQPVKRIEPVVAPSAPAQEPVTNVQPTQKEKVVYDILSGGAFHEGSVVNVEAPAGRAVTAADFAALVNGTSQNATTNNMSQAPANNNDKILELSKRGLTIVEIAKNLNLGVGEVKLVLDLFSKK